MVKIACIFPQMGERLLLCERCLAIQLVRENPPPRRPPGPGPPQQSRSTTSHAAQQSRPVPTSPDRPLLPLTRPQSLPNPRGVADLATTPGSDSDTPTPTNGLDCTTGWSANTASLASPVSNNKNIITNYQDGYLLFLVSSS